MQGKEGGGRLGYRVKQLSTKELESWQAAQADDLVTYPEIGTALGITHQAVDFTVRRAIRRLWRDRDLRAAYYNKQMGRLPANFRLLKSGEGMI